MPVYLDKRFHPDFRDPKVRPYGPVEIDWSNPLSRGLIFYPTWEGNTGRCLVTGEVGAVVGTITQEITPVGMVLRSAGASSVTFSKPKNIGGGPFTIITSYSWDGVSSVNQCGVCLPSSDFGTMYIPDGSLAWDTVGGGQTNMGFNAPQGDVDAGVFATWSICNHQHSSGSPGLFAYKNGSRLTHGATNHTYAPTAGDPVRLFHGQSNHFGAGDISFVGLWDRQLSEAEQIMMFNDPFQILKPMNSVSYGVSSGNVRSEVIAPFIPPLVDFIFRAPKTTGGLPIHNIDAEVTIYAFDIASKK